MNILKRKSKEKYFNVKPELKKAYGRNWRMLSAINQNTEALKDIANELKKINEKSKG